MSKLKVFLDAGHGPNNSKVGAVDPGAVDPVTKLTEYNLVKEIALAVVEMAKADPSLPFEIIEVPELSRTGVANYVNMHSRNCGKSILLSLHMNASKFPASSGTIVVVAKTARKERVEEAITLGLEFAKATSRLFLGVYTDNQTAAGTVSILRNTVVPAYLLEMGFIGNTLDRIHVRENGATGVINALVAYCQEYFSEPNED